MAAASEKKAKTAPSRPSFHKESATEIADIFRTAKENSKKKTKNKKRKEVEVGIPSSNPEVKEEKKKKKRKKKEVDREEEEGSSLKKSKRRRTTNDGLSIYSAEELGFGNPEAGGTPLCPFDCSCCF